MMAKEPKLGFVPYIDTYIVVSLDAEATVNFYCDAVDEIARSEIQGQSFRKYAGYCADIEEKLPWPDREFHQIEFSPLQQGLSRSTKTREVEPHMPLRTTKPLPWSNCYHPTYPTFMLRVDNTTIDYSDATEADGDDAIYVNFRGNDDMRRIHQLHAAKVAGVPAPELVLPSDSHHSDDEDDEDDDNDNDDEVSEECWSDFGSENSSPEDGNDKEEDGDGQEDDAAETEIETLQCLAQAAFDIRDSHPEEDSRLIPIIRVSPNLAEVGEELPDFHEIYGEFEVLQGIIDRAKSRAKEAAEKFARDNPIEVVVNGKTSGVKQTRKESVVQKRTKEVLGIRSLFRQVKKSIRNVTAQVVAYVKKYTQGAGVC